MAWDRSSSRWTASVAFALLLAIVHVPFMYCDPCEGVLTAAVSEISYTAIIEVQVTDNVGRNVSGASVTLVGNDTYTAWPADEYGRLTITGLLADSNGTEYNLSAQCDGYLELAAVSAIAKPFTTTWVNLTVKGGAIYGSITENWVPVTGANVSLDDYGLNTTSGSDGSYRIEGLKEGTYSVTVTAVNHDPLTRIVTLPIDGIAKLDFALTSKMGSISGVVLHATSFEPIEDANVSVKVEGPTPVTITVTTEADGAYYVPSLPAGTYSISVSLEGFNTSTVEDVVVLSGIDTTDVDVLLEEKPTAMWGIVRSGSILLVGANVSVRGTDYYGLSSIEGTYEINGIPAGTYIVEVSLQGYLNVTVSAVKISRGSNLELDFNLTGLPGGLSGMVVDFVTGQSLSGVKIVLLPQREVVTNVNGEFEFTGLKEGNYTLRVTLDGYRPVEISPIVVTHEEIVDLGEIRLETMGGSFGGFIFGFDLAHSMMILALFLTIVILALAVVLRIRTFEAPDKAPAIYDELYDEEEEEREAAEGAEERGAESKSSAGRPRDETNHEE